MQIDQGATATVVFFLVQDDGRTPAPKADPAVRISVAGGPFVASTNPAWEIGDGWYAVELTADETAELGPLVVVADGEQTMEWRNIHYVEAPHKEIDQIVAAVLAQIRTDEIAEAAAGLIDAEAIAAGLEQAAREAVRETKIGLQFYFED